MTAAGRDLTGCDLQPFGRTDQERSAARRVLASTALSRYPDDVVAAATAWAEACAALGLPITGGAA